MSFCAVATPDRPISSCVITISGALSINYVAERVPAILEGFYLGQETGAGVADVLFGDYNPSGKLPVSFPSTTIRSRRRGAAISTRTRSRCSRSATG